jgi:hypothetical protein
MRLILKATTTSSDYGVGGNKNWIFVISSKNEGADCSIAIAIKSVACTLQGNVLVGTGR